MNVLWQQWSQSGRSGLYYGIGPEISRGILSSALMLMIKERIAVIGPTFTVIKNKEELWNRNDGA